MNYSMAPPRDAVDQTVARPPVADGDPYSTPVPRHFAGVVKCPMTWVIIVAIYPK